MWVVGCGGICQNMCVIFGSASTGVTFSDMLVHSSVLGCVHVWLNVHLTQSGRFPVLFNVCRYAGHFRVIHSISVLLVDHISL